MESIPATGPLTADGLPRLDEGRLRHAGLAKALASGALPLLSDVHDQLHRFRHDRRHDLVHGLLAVHGVLDRKTGRMAADLIQAGDRLSRRLRHNLHIGLGDCIGDLCVYKIDHGRFSCSARDCRIPLDVSPFPP